MKYLYYLSLNLTFFLTSFIALSQTGNITISGRVAESVHHQPLPAVSISTSDGSHSTTSNSDGSFKLTIPAGSEVNFRLLGYKPAQITPQSSQRNLFILLGENKLELDEVVVQGYESNRSILETPAAVAVASEEVLQRFNKTSLVPSLNTLPGVRMEERAPASYRLSIRGSTLRSPYGVRNVKVYLNEIPFTDASGVTPLNLLDVEMFERAEVLRGPAGSIYGAGTGGTVILNLRRSKPGQLSLRSGYMAGSYGLRRFHANGHSSDSTSTTMAQYTHQQYGGYRNHSAMDRHTLMANAQFYPSAKQVLTVQAFYTKLFYELPGGITREQFEEDPRQVRPVVISQNSSFNQEAAMLGVSQQYHWNKQWSSTLSLYGSFSSVDHPFVTDYERNSIYGLGGRSITTFQTNIGSVGLNLSQGSEYQRGYTSARNYRNNGGRPDTLRFDDEIISDNSINFGQAEAVVPGGWIFSFGISHTLLKYEITRVSDAALQQDYALEREFEGQISPRLAVLKKLSDNISAYASVGQGFSPPTEAEVRTSDGSINQQLEPEKGTNYELGLRGNIFNSRLGFDFTAFYFQLTETIVTRTAPSGVVLFANAGSTDQRGIETAMHYYLIREPEQFFNNLKLWGSYNYYYFRFEDYQQNTDDYSGNRLTGVAPHTFTTGLDLGTLPGLYLYLTANYADEAPLNDANTVFSDEYLTFSAKLGWQRELGRWFRGEIFAGIDNATDVRYSLGNDLNAFGGRYFQAAPARNYYTGATLTFFLRRSLADELR